MFEIASSEWSGAQCGPPRWRLKAQPQCTVATRVVEFVDYGGLVQEKGKTPRADTVLEIAFVAECGCFSDR